MLDLTVGTEIVAQVQAYLVKNKVDSVRVVRGLEICANAVPMTRMVNKSDDFITAMNHRYLKDQLQTAASKGKRSNIHGFTLITSYAYGTEMTMGDEGKY
ncbi:MAG: hypothetical protein J6I40_05495 [Mailhella sp.]|nr:hypothetical protein [Mailhella sp.]